MSSSRTTRSSPRLGYHQVLCIVQNSMMLDPVMNHLVTGGDHRREHRTQSPVIEILSDEEDMQEFDLTVHDDQPTVLLEVNTSSNSNNDPRVDLTDVNSVPTVIDLSSDEEIESLSSVQEYDRHTQENELTVIDLTSDRDVTEILYLGEDDRETERNIPNILTGVKRKLDSAQNGLAGAIKRFKKDMAEFEDSFDCAVCKGILKKPTVSYKDSSLGCGHSSCQACLQSWFSQCQDQVWDYTCPVCREEVRNPPAENFQLSAVLNVFFGSHGDTDTSADHSESTTSPWSKFNFMP
ncbi:hypothetical protein GYMLUDRAFT_64584 [Collybiopsis luxurians FD-317 M1]|uniref:RING-type domain-containing protein n=1 Tax=Collybiopsis luxurians FD-317 M1 TaxID=944289 RepID=A0A0D0BQD4_9AGAR|nr:hypothetical protein GYMLUDRAFT_64584 [Collybiopsis luxurians FD-317 M1]